MATLDLKVKLEKNSAPLRTVHYHIRIKQILPHEANILQDELDSISVYTQTRNMRLNPLKTIEMLFYPLHKWAFQPTLITNGSDILDVVEEYKILGYFINSNLRTTPKTDYICQRAYIIRECGY